MEIKKVIQRGAEVFVSAASLSTPSPVEFRFEEFSSEIAEQALAMDALKKYGESEG